MSQYPEEETYNDHPEADYSTLLSEAQFYKTDATTVKINCDGPSRTHDSWVESGTFRFANGDSWYGIQLFDGWSSDPGHSMARVRVVSFDRPYPIERTDLQTLVNSVTKQKCKSTKCKSKVCKEELVFYYYDTAQHWHHEWVRSE